MDYKGNVSFYVASKTYHYPMWQRLRKQGADIIASWIDMVEREKEYTDEKWAQVSEMCLKEASVADVLILYARNGDVLRRAYMETGVALLCGKKVGVVFEEGFETTEILLPHTSVRTFSSVEEAISYYEASADREDDQPQVEDIRQFLTVKPRVESGAVRFGDDWPGLFLRGDEAFFIARQLDVALETLKGYTDLSPAGVAFKVLEGLRSTIDNQVRIRNTKL